MRNTGIFIILLLLFWSCMDDDSIYEKNRFDVDSDPALKAYISNQRGLFVLNEGNFMYDNSSLSYYLIDSMKVINNLFERVNGLPLGDVAQSMTIKDRLGYMVINNSGKIYVINIDNFKLVGKITGLISPRYIHFVSDTKAYVTDLYAKAITIVNPSTFQITGSISVNNFDTRFYQHPTEQMVQVGNRLFVSCWSYDNKVLVIDTNTDKVIDSLEVITQPRAMVLDKFNKLWVLSDGGADGNPFAHERPGLTCIDPETMEVEKIFRFGLNENPHSLCINGTKDTLFLIKQHVWKMAVNSTRFPDTPFIQSRYDQFATGGFYSLAIDSLSSEVYVSDGVDNVQHGYVYRYSPLAQPIDTINVGILPGAIVFR